METSQLVLIDDEDGGTRAWRLDEPTREAGRRGIAKVRQALAEAAARRHDTEHPSAA